MFKKKYTFYLPKLNKTITIKAKDESVAVWKLVNLFRKREADLENYEIISE